MINNELTIKNLLVKYKQILKNANIKTYSLDCEVLLMNVTGFDKIKLYTNLSYTLKSEEFEKFKTFIDKRINNEPIPYIINKCEFMGLDFLVNNNTLIPREDTEILVEEVINLINENNYTSILDIGTGSGAIAVSIANYCKNANIVAIDISSKALEVAKKNAMLNNVDNKITFIKSNLFENLKDLKFDIIISNPPYIKTKEIESLERNVKDFEPHLALDGGDDGLYFYKKITKKSSEFLKNKGYLFYEIGFDQAEDVSKILEQNEFKNIKILKDLKNFNRVVFGNLN